jgi:polyisoprenyl-phosphate glycosyltransferase
MQKAFSVVIPIYKNEATIVELCQLLTHYLQMQTNQFEIILVNDASPDNSLDVIKKLKKSNPHIEYVENTHNLGQNQSILKGVSKSKGDYIIVMDADLQDNPALILKMIEQIEKGYDAVFVKRHGQYQSFFRMFASNIFKSILYYLNGLDKTAGTFFIINRQVRERILGLKSPKPHVPSMVALSSRQIAYVEGIREKRRVGNSAYSFKKRMQYAWSTLECIFHLKF